jgi:hypothetical protein
MGAASYLLPTGGCLRKTEMAFGRNDGANPHFKKAISHEHDSHAASETMIIDESKMMV